MPVTLVQAKARGLQPGSSGTPLSATITFDTGVTSGSAVIVTALHQSQAVSAVISGISGLGGSWQLVTTYPDWQTDGAWPNHPYGGTWINKAVTSGTTITLTLNASDPFDSIAIVASEWRGISPTLTPQPAAFATNTGSAPGSIAMTPSGVVTTPNAPALIYVAGLRQGQALVTGGPTSGFAALAEARSQTANTSVSDRDSRVIAAWRDVTLTGTYGTSWFDAAELPSRYWWLQAIAFRETGPSAALAGTDAGVSSEWGMLSAASHVYVPPAVINVPDRHLFGAADLATYAVIQRGAMGSNSHPALRGNVPAWSGLPGSQPLEQLPDSRIYALNLFVRGTSAAGAGSTANDAATARENLDALHAVLTPRFEQQLIRVMPDGTGRQAMAKVWSVQDIDGRVANVLFALRVEFMLADPWFYSDTVVSGPTAMGSATVQFNINHPGSVRGHKALIDFLGPHTNPRLTNLTTGTYVQYTGAVGSNQRLIIDSEHFSATLAGVSVVGSISHGGGVPFMWFDPGVNVLQATSNPSGGSVTVTFAPPYI